MSERPFNPNAKGKKYWPSIKYDIEGTPRRFESEEEFKREGEGFYDNREEARQALADREAGNTPTGATNDDEDPKTVEEVLAMVDTVPFPTFKAEAQKVLGEDAPNKKAELIEALKARAPGQPQTDGTTEPEVDEYNRDEAIAKLAAAGYVVEDDTTDEDIKATLAELEPKEA